MSRDLSDAQTDRAYADGTSDLGQRLRSARRAAGLSLTQVSTATEISRSFLTLVEAGKSDITISRLLRLVDYYGIKVGDLVSSEPREYAVVRRGGGRQIASRGEGMSLFVLLPDDRRSIRSMLVTLEPEGRMAEHARHDGDEYAYVLSGAAAL